MALRYKFRSGGAWVWRRRLMVTLESLAADGDVLTLFETYHPGGQLKSARLSSDPQKIKPARLTLSKSLACFRLPGSLGTSGSVAAGTKVEVREVQALDSSYYAQVPGRGWILLPQESIHR